MFAISCNMILETLADIGPLVELLRYEITSLSPSQASPSLKIETLRLFVVMDADGIEY